MGVRQECSMCKQNLYNMTWNCTHWGCPNNEEVRVLGRESITKLNELTKKATRQEKWDLRFLELATIYGSWSKDPSSKVGAVIADDNLQVSQGYNGFPKGCDDDPAIYADRERKYLRIIHAERNALHYSNRDNHKGCTMYCTLPSCCQCTGDIITAGIKRLVYYEPPTQFAIRWTASIKEATKMCKEAGVEIVIYKRKGE